MSDASAICNLLIRSIRELCIADHHGDERVLSVWLEGKTPEKMAQWIASREIITIVCTLNESVVGVASIGLDGYVHLCYVDPDHIGKGIGQKMLLELLRIAKVHQNDTLRLISTATARAFYQKNGFIGSGKPTRCFGIPGYPMSKDVNFPVRG